MSKAPLVSVVIPAYNAEKYLAEAIDSVLCQTFGDMEVIVVDDGSTDGTRAVMESYGQRIHPVFGPNRGGSAARNVGVGQARGRYVQFLDSDDLLKPDKVEVCLSQFDESVDAVFCRLSEFHDTPAAAPSRYRALRKQLIRRLREPAMQWDPNRQLEFLTRRAIGTPAPLHLTEVVRRAGGFDESLRNLQDIEFHFRLGVLGVRFRYVDAALVRVRHHASPHRLRHQSATPVYTLRALRTMVAYAEDHGALEPEIRAALGDRLASSGRLLCNAERWDEARAAFLEARRLTPRPSPTPVPLYNAFGRLLGVERFERMRAKLRTGIRRD